MKRLLLLALIAPAASAVDLTIHLQNGTDKEKGVVGAEVSLLLPVQDTRKKVALTIESGDSVTFQVDDSLRGQKINVMAAYAGGSYFFTGGAEVGKPEAGPFAVFEATEDPAAMQVVHHLIQIQAAEEQMLFVKEALLVQNETDRAYIGIRLPRVEFRGSLILHLPGQAHGLQIEPNGFFLANRIQQAEDFLISDVTIVPGENVYEFSYYLPIRSGEVDFEKSFRHPTQRLTIISPRDEGFHVSAAGLEASHKTDPHTGGEVLLLERAGLPAHETIAIHVHTTGEAAGATRGGGKEKKEEEDQFIGPWHVWLLAALTIGAFLAVAASLRPNPPGGVQVEKMRELLVDEIARLDLSRERGEIGEEYHKKQRESLKKRLLELG